MKIILAALVLMSFALQAEECADLGKCVEYVSKLTGKKYMYDKEFKGGLQTSSNVQINAENADILFTSILEINGYGRVPTGVKDVYKIVTLRDIRYETVPKISVDSETAPTVVPNSDYYLMSYKFKNYKHNQMRETANSLRPFMSRYGRVIEIKQSGFLILQESSAKINQLYDMIKANDRELTKEEIIASEKEEKKQEMREKHGRKEELKPELVKAKKK